VRLVCISAIKELKLMRRDPAVLFWMGIPLVIGLLIYVVFGRGDITPQGRLLIADEDKSITSNLLIAAFTRQPLRKMLVVENVDRAGGLNRITRGGASAFLFIPQGLQTAFLRKEPFRLELYTNPEQRILPKIVEEAVSTAVESSFYVQHAMVPTDPRTAISRAAAFGSSLASPLIRLQLETIQQRRQNTIVAVLFFRPWLLWRCFSWRTALPATSGGSASSAPRAGWPPRPALSPVCSQAA
jgi:hypothetical protein